MIFVLRGTTNSGKDRFCETYFSDHCVLSSDKIRMMILGNMKDQTKNNEVFSLLRHILELRLSVGVPYTVINATNLKFKDAESYITIAERFGSSVTVISIDPPGTDVLIQRNRDRGATGGLEVPEDVIHRHVSTYFSAMSRFVQAEREYSNYKFIRVDQHHEVIV